MALTQALGGQGFNDELGPSKTCNDISGDL